LHGGGQPEIDRDLMFRRFDNLSFDLPGDPFDRFLQQVKPDDALQVLRWAADGRGPERKHWSALALLAVLQELAGEREAALDVYRQIRTHIRYEELTSQQYAYSRTRERIDWSLARMLDVTPGQLGIRQESVPATLREAYGLGERNRVLVGAVEDAAAAGGVQVNDIIVGINGASIDLRYYDDILGELAVARAGDPISLQIYRDGREENLQFRLGKRDMSRYIPPERDRRAIHTPLAQMIDNTLFQTRTLELQRGEWVVAELQPLLREAYQLPEDQRGVLVFDRRRRSNDDLLRAGDLIVEVAGQPVGDLDELTRLFELARSDQGEVFVKVYHHGRLESLLLVP